MEPITALLSIIAAYGVQAVVRALGGDKEVADLSSDLFRALATSESRLDARLSAIEAKLDEVVEQRYRIALGTGLRYLLDANVATGNRAHDLDRARAVFIEATTAARSSLQQAIAERYLLLTLVAQKRGDLVPSSLGQLESAATAAAFEIVRHTANSSGLSSSSSRSPKVKMRLRARNHPDSLVPAQIQSTALEPISICARLLAEASALASAYRLQPRTAPPTGAMEVPRSTSDTESNGFWSFRMKIGDILRIGCITIRIVPREEAVHRELRETTAPIAVAHIDLEPPLPRPIWITVHPPPFLYEMTVVQAGQTETEFALQARLSGREGTLRTRLKLRPSRPDECFISLVEIVVEPSLHSSPTSAIQH